MTTKVVLLDHQPLSMEVDELVVEPAIPGLEREREEPRIPCAGADGQPVARFKDGTTLWVHCPAEGTLEPFDFTLESRKPHGWHISVMDEERGGRRVRVARIVAFLKELGER